MIRNHRPVLALLIAVALATVALAEKHPFIAPVGWGPYFKTDKGEMKNLQEPLEKNSDKDWMFLQFTDYIGPKNRLAVMQVENKTANMEQFERTKEGTFAINPRVAEVPVAGIEELITASFVNCKRYRLVERKALDQTLAEQDLGAGGRVAKPSAAAVGKMLGAQFLIFAAVNEWTPERSKTGGAAGAVAGGILGGVGLGGIGAKKSEAEVAMSFRIVDATSGEVITSIVERAKAGSWGLGFGAGGFGSGGGGGGIVGIEKNAPISFAVQSCINKAVYKIATALADRPWYGSVMKVSEEKVYVNAGSASGLTAGMQLSVLAKGEELVDPETGTTLGSELTPIGSLKIVDVQEKYSVANITEGCVGMKAGDVLQQGEDKPGDLSSDNIRVRQSTLKKDEFSWFAMGRGMSGSVEALAVHNDRLIASGNLKVSGRVSSIRIAMWDGAKWSALDGIEDGGADALTTYNNQLVVGGHFKSAGGIEANCVAAWDGTTWSNLGSGMSSHGRVLALSVYNGMLIAGGVFTSAGGVAVNNIAAWDGVKWSSVGEGTGAPVKALAVYGNKLIAAGEFEEAGDIAVAHIAGWDGTSWSPLGSGISGGEFLDVTSLAVLNNRLIAAGQFANAGGVEVSNIAMWNGSTWAGLGSGISQTGKESTPVMSLGVYADKLIVSGSFDAAGEVRTHGIAAWDGTEWSALGSGVSGGMYGSVIRVMAYHDELIATGDFTAAGGVRCDGIAAWRKN